MYLVDFDKDVTQRVSSELQESNLHVEALDVMNKAAMDGYLSSTPVNAIISSLPYYCNPAVGELARAHELHYFDLTEDIEVTKQIKTLSEGSTQAFVPQ